MDKQAIAVIMHHSVREFFLRPHSSVIGSRFQNVSEKLAQKMIAITCIRYLDLHYRELGKGFQSPVGARVSNWGFEDIITLAQYLNSRPLIKYSLEYLKQLQGVDSGIQKPFSDLTTNIRKYPFSLQSFLLKKLIDCNTDTQLLEKLTDSNTDTQGLEKLTNTDTQRVHELNRLLEFAAERGYTVAAGNLLAAGAECNTALHRAAWGGHPAMVRLLLDQGADIEIRDPADQTPLHKASLCGHEATIRLLLDRGAEIDAMDCKEQSLLCAAVWGGHWAAVRLLGDRGAVRETGSYEWTTQHDVALDGYGAVGLLHNRAADTKAKGSDKEILLQKAITCRFEGTVKMLIDRGAFVGAKDSDNQTPLHMAASGGHEPTVRLLLNRGAGIEAKGAGNQTPLHEASLHGHEATVRLLLDRRAEINAMDSCRQTPLHKASLLGHEATARLLLDRGAEIDAMDSCRQIPLHKASLHGHEATVRLLLNRGADIGAKDSSNLTPLHKAASNGHEAQSSCCRTEGPPSRTWAFNT